MPLAIKPAGPGSEQVGPDRAAVGAWIEHAIFRRKAITVNPSASGPIPVVPVAPVPPTPPPALPSPPSPDPCPPPPPICPPTVAAPTYFDIDAEVRYPGDKPSAPPRSVAKYRIEIEQSVGPRLPDTSK